MTMIDFDSLLKILGPFGRYQVIVFVSLLYYQVPGGLNVIAPVFLAYTPIHRCLMYPFDNSTLYPNLTKEEIMNLTTSLNEQGLPKNPCVRYGYNLTQCALEEDLSCVNKSKPKVKCDGYFYDDSVFEATAVTEFNLVCERGILNSVGTSMYLAGVLVASLFFGNISDRFGRKIPSIVAVCGMLLSMLLVAYSSNVEMFIAGRFITALFTFGANIALFCHIMEIVGTKWRAFVGVTYHIGYAAGYMLWSGIAYIYRDWHKMQLGALVISTPLALILFLVPESPRWLFVKGYNEKGKKVTSLMAKLNKVELSDKDWDEVEKLIPVEEKTGRRYSVIDLFRTPGLRQSSITIGFYSFVNNTVYYGIAYGTGSLAGNIFLNNVYGGLLEIASCVVCLLTLDCIGRRLLLAITLSGTGILLMAMAILSEYAGENESLIQLGVILAFIARGLASGSTAVFCNFTAEFFPTVIRGNGIGFSSTCARIGSISCPFVIAIQAHISWIPNAVFGMLAVVAGLVALTLRDTTNVSLMETITEVEIFISGIKPARKDQMQINNDRYKNNEVDRVT